MKGLRFFSLIVSATVAAGAAMAQEAFTNDELAALALDVGKPGLIAKFRNKTLTVSGTLARFVDTGYGATVSVTLEGTKFNSWKAVCTFPRDNQTAYDHFAQIKQGDMVVFTGLFQDASDAFYDIYLSPCQPGM